VPDEETQTSFHSISGTLALNGIEGENLILDFSPRFVHYNNRERGSFKTRRKMDKEKNPGWAQTGFEARAARKKEMGELRDLVLRRDGTANWGAIRENFFEKMGNRWYPTVTWTGRTACGPSIVQGKDDEVWKIFLDEDILSAKQDGNYMVMGAGMPINPRLHHMSLFFVRKEDAEAYVDLVYGGAKYEIEIIKCLIAETKTRR
jgi:hypothetical protein